MAQAHLLFTQRYNSYSVKVVNLEHLSVVQIQELESFVSKRKGVFDFNTYSFSIQKKIEFYEFVSLVESLKMDVRCEENIVLKVNQARIGFGQYKGMQYNELTNSYMLWLKTNYSGPDREIIEKELHKRNI